MKLIKGMNFLKLDIQYFANSSAMSTDNKYIKYKISITQNSQNVANNKTNVTVKVFVYRTNTGYTSYGSGTCYCKINGTKYSASITTSQKFTYNSNTVVFTKTLDIPHNADGTKTLTCSAWLDHDVVTSEEQSYSQVLTTIPRGSVLGTISNFTLGNAIDIPITKYSSSFTDTLVISLNGTTIKTIDGITNGYDVSFTTAELTKIYGLIPSGTTGTFTFKLTTKSGSTQIGTSSKTATGTIPSSVKPSISSVTVSEAGSVPSGWGVYVKNKSKLKFVVSASAGTGSSISSIKTTINGGTYTGSTITTNLINASGTLTATITVTDNRGRTATTTKNVTIVDYDVPYITSLTAIRCDKDGNPLENGTYAKVSLVGGVYSVSGKNTSSYSIKYKKTSETEYQTHTFDVTSSSISDSVILSGIETNSSYNIMGVIGDYFTEISENMNPPLMSVFRTMNFLQGGRGGAVGKMAELENVWEIAFQTKLTGGLMPIFLEADTDLNDVRIPNFYTGQNISSFNYGNCPLTSGTFYLEVVSMGTDGQVRQTITSCSKTNSVTYERVYYQETWGEWKNCFVGEEVIYDNAEGSNETITLSTPATQYEYLEIYFTDNNNSGCGYTKIYKPNGKVADLSLTEASSGATTYIRRTEYTISGSTITPNLEFAGYVKITNGTASTLSATNYLKITRVVGKR